MGTDTHICTVKDARVQIYTLNKRASPQITTKKLYISNRHFLEMQFKKKIKPPDRTHLIKIWFTGKTVRLVLSRYLDKIHDDTIY